MKKFLLLAALLPALALGHGAPVIWNGTSAKWLPSGLNSAGVCKLSASGVMSSSTVSDSELASSYLYADGTRGLSGAWNAGQNITAPSFIGALTGNASTATALASNPTDCGAGTKATSIDASGNLTCSAVSLTADVSGTLPVTNGGTGTATQFTSGSIVIAGQNGVYTQDSSNLFWDDDNNRLGLGTASPAYRLDVAATNASETVLSLDPQTGTDVDFRFENSVFRIDRGSTSLLVYNNNMNLNSAVSPMWHVQIQSAATQTTLATYLTRDQGLPVFGIKNSSSTANNASGIAFAGNSNASGEATSGILGVHESHTGGAETGHLEFWTRNAGTPAKRLNIANDGVLTASAYGAGVLQADSSGVISSSAVDLATSDVTGTLPVANGGTGQTSYTDGQLLIGNSSGNTLTKSTLTAGSNITITNGGGSITIAASGGSSTLSVATKTTDYTMTNSDDVILCNTTTSMEVTMHSVSSATTKSYKIKNVGSGTCNVKTDGFDIFDRVPGETSASIPAGGLPTSGFELIPDSGGSSWSIF